MTLLRHARLVLPTGVVPDGWLRTTGDRITGIGAEASIAGDQRPTEPPLPAPGEATHDLGGRHVTPGFVDMHVHGGGGASFISGDPEQARTVVAFHRAHGTTTSVASTVTASIEDLTRAIDSLADLAQDGLIAGVHLEGPFINRSRCGAHDPTLLRDPDPATIDKLLRAGRGAVRMVTLAPELTGGVAAVRQLAEAGVVAAFGHTDGTHAQAKTAIAAGASVATHLFNAMRSVHHREPGPVTAALESPDVVVEIVNDGVHLHPSVVDLAFTVAGRGRVALITDAMGAAGMQDGDYMLGALRVRVQGGVARLPDSGALAGSTLTLDAALRRSVTENRRPITEAVEAVATTPARVLGIGHRTGSLEVGKVADLVVLDDALQVVAVMARGAWVAGGVQALDAAAVASPGGSLTS